MITLEYRAIIELLRNHDIDAIWNGLNITVFSPYHKLGELTFIDDKLIAFRELSIEREVFHLSDPDVIVQIKKFYGYNLEKKIC